MIDLDKIEYLTRLYDLYSSLLTPKMMDILNQYLNFNLSISEISDLKKISRSAVLDTLHKGIKKLEYYEEKLKLNQKITKIEKSKKEQFTKEEITDIFK